MRHALASIALLLASGMAAGQAPADARVPLEPGRANQKIERIRIEDSGARIDELRVGGQTQSITVQPKADVPAYEVQPADMARTRAGDARDGTGTGGGQRYWNILKF